MLNKRTLAMGIAGSALSVIAIGGVAAATSNTPSLASEIAQKFNLNQTDVQSVINQHKTEEKTAQATSYQHRLDAAVKGGKITAAEETQIKVKHDEFVAYVASIKSESAAQKRADIKAKVKETRTYAKDNHIPFGLFGIGGAHMNHHDKAMMKMEADK